MDRLETDIYSVIRQLKSDLHSSMDRLETLVTIKSFKNVKIFTFQYG